MSAPRDPAACERFLDEAIAPVHRNTEVTPLIDGERYLGAVLEAMERTRGPGDVIFILAWQLDPAWRGVGELLAARARAGVDVRLVLNAAFPALADPWRANRAAARALRAQSPLDHCVLLDWEGMSWSATHHQKVFLVRAGGEAVGFVGGMDLVSDHHDAPPHAQKRWPDGTPWGWHDAGVRVRGDAVSRLWENFGQRWDEARRQRRSRLLGLSNPLVEAAPPPPPPGPLTPSAQRVQVLRACFRWRRKTHELHRALRRAIANAERYLYVEDQFLSDRGADILRLPFPWPPALVPIPEEFSLFAAVAERLRARPGLKVIFVGSGKSDPIDTVPGPRNRRLTASLRALRGDVAVWRVDDVTVHSKVVIIDDEYAAIGSANFHKRAMYGVDDELQVAFAGGGVKELRMQLWDELWRRPPTESLDQAVAPWSGTTGPGLSRVT